MKPRLFSQTAEYALRAGAWLARSGGEPVRAGELSAEAGIPPQYVAKILRRLVRAGVLASRKGRGGGFVLVRPPAEITFRDVLEAIDAYPRDDRCAFGWGRCDSARPCPLHHSWSALSARFREWAGTCTLGDVAAGAASWRPHAWAAASPARRTRRRG